LWSGLSLYPRLYVRVPAIQSLHLPRQLPGLGSGLPHYRLPRIWQVNLLAFPPVMPSVQSAFKRFENPLIAVSAVACRSRLSESRYRQQWVCTHHSADFTVILEPNELPTAPPRDILRCKYR
jgi:hypothetical protein